MMCLLNDKLHKLLEVFSQCDNPGSQHVIKVLPYNKQTLVQLHILRKQDHHISARLLCDWLPPIAVNNCI